jgi:nicotinate-nucleotide adenylyltransferase
MSKIAILGGTFDPFHNGHLEVAAKAASSVDLDKVIIIPAKVSPFKQGREMASEDDRFEMTRLAVEGLENIEVSRIELDNDDVSYTFYTLSRLSVSYPKDEISLIVGSDQFIALDTWHKGVDILENFGIILARRPDNSDSQVNEKAEYYRETYGTNISMLKNDFVDISSTEIKELIATNRPIKGLVPEKVEEYIYEHGLYRETDRN